MSNQEIEKVFSTLPRAHPSEIQKFLNGYADGDSFIGEAVARHIPGKKFGHFYHLDLFGSACMAGRLIKLVDGLYWLEDLKDSWPIPMDLAYEIEFMLRTWELYPETGPNEVTGYLNKDQAAFVHELLMSIVALGSGSPIAVPFEAAASAWADLLDRPCYYRSHFELLENSP